MQRLLLMLKLSGVLALIVLIASVALRLPVAWAGGSGELVPFPLTGAYRASHREDRGHIAVIDFVGNYDAQLDSGANNVEARAVVAQEFLRTHPDTYDFLVVVSAFEFDTGNTLAFHWGVQNQVQGIGLALYDVSHLFGSSGQLLGYIDMAALSRYATDPLQPGFEKTLSTLGHEVMHQWSGRVRFVDAAGKVSDALIGKDETHWSDLLHTEASVLYGHKWRDNQDGTFTSEATQTFFSPLDLYLAGWYTSAEVPPFFLIDNPDHNAAVLPRPDITVAGSARTLTIEDVIAAEGPRHPTAAEAPREIRLAFIWLTTPDTPVETAQITAVEQMGRKFAERFAVWTGGRAMAHITPMAIPTVTPGTPQTVEGGDVRDTPAELSTALGLGLDWLRSQQKPDGSWMDKPATQLRDTTVVFEVMSTLEPAFSGRTRVLEWVAAQTPENTDYQSRQANSMGRAGETISLWVAPLMQQQRDDGGWGIGPGYASDALDTALALSALKHGQGIDFQAVELGLTYLVDHQHANGSWSVVTSGAGRIQVTTRVLDTLQAFNRHTAVQDAGLAWLAGQQQADGGFGDGERQSKSKSTVHDTAHVLRAVIRLEATDRIRAEAAATYLLARQRIDGSWGGSTYATALAVAALNRWHFPNWRLEAEMTAEPEQPIDGNQVLLSLTVRNNGQSIAPEGVLRLFDGEPNQGGPQIGDDLRVPILAAGAAVTLQPRWNTRGLPGDHTLIAVVDPDQVIAEGNELDNRVTRHIRVAEAPTGVDLSVEALTVMPAAPNTLPVTLGLSATVRNTGLSAAGPVRVQLREGTADSSRVVAEQVYDTVPGRSSIAVSLTTVLSQAGSIPYALIVDADNTIAESDETNNRISTTVETRPSVDLVISASDIVVSPHPSIAGDDLTFTVALHNMGTSLSPAARVRYVITDGSSTTELDIRTIRIEAGQSIERTLTWRADRPRALTFTVQIDPDQLIPELDEQNNIASFAFSVGNVKGPNLVVSFADLTMTPNPGLEGQPVTLSALVRNTGDDDVKDVEVIFYDGDPSQGGVPIGLSQSIASLSGGASTVVSVTWPSIPDTSDKLVVVRVDPNQRIAEFSETDNTAFQVLDILGLPDLALTAADVTLTPAFPASGETVHVEARIANLGEQAVTGVVVRATAGDPAAGGIRIGADQTVSIATGEVAVVPFTWMLSGAEPVRTLVVDVDPDQVLREQSELNNTARKTVGVQDGDFMVSERYISPNGDGIKDTTTFFFRLAEPRDIRIAVVNIEDTVVRQLPEAGLMQVRDGSVEWDGVDDQGRVVPDGRYRLQVRSQRLDGASLGEAVTVVDNNRSPLVNALGTPFGAFTNLTCQLGSVGEMVITDDEDTIFLTVGDSDHFDRGLYRMSGSGTSVNPLIPLQPDEFIETMQAAPDGSIVATIVGKHGRHSTTYQLVLTDGEGANRRDISLTDIPTQILAISLATQEILLTTEEQTASSREHVIAVSVWGGSPRVLYSTSDRFEELVFYSMSPSRDRFIVKVGTTTYVMELGTAESYVIATDTDERQVEDIQWSPDGTKIAIKNFSERADGTLSYQLSIVTPTGDMYREISLPLTGHSDPCVYLTSDNMVWSPTQDAVAFDLVQEGIPECTTGDIFAGGVYLSDIESGMVSQISSFDLSARGYHIGSHDQALGWFHDGTALFHNWFNRDITATLLKPDYPQVSVLEADETATSRVANLGLSPTGRQLIYHDSRDADNPESRCYEQGGSDVWSYKSLLNLTADLQATRIEQGAGLLLHGTASDLHLDRYRLDYAATSAPENWQLLEPDSGQSVINSAFTTWVPPAPGTYWVRLTVTDLAGNQRQQRLRVSWSDTTSITHLYRTPHLFSPNGDGILDEVAIHYRVLEPVHLTFAFYNDSGDRVRTLTRDHTEVGLEQTVMWDGRDDRGLVLPDGSYRMEVQHFTLPIGLDRTPPAVELSLQGPYQSISKKIGEKHFSVVAVQPTLAWSLTESHLLNAVIEQATLDQPDQWQVVVESDAIRRANGEPNQRRLSLGTVDRARFRLVAEDQAGNRTVAQVGATPQLMIDGFGDHQLNSHPDDCSLQPSELDACIRNQGGDYQSLQPVPYAPLVSSDGPEFFIAVTADTVRFAVAETIAEPLAYIMAQYRPVSESDWQEIALTEFIDRSPQPNAFSEPLNQRMEAIWSLPELTSNMPYIVRLKAVDQFGQEHVSNIVRFSIERNMVFQGLILHASRQDQWQYELPRYVSTGKTGLWGLNLSTDGLRDVRLWLKSSEDPRYRVEREVDRLDYPGEVLIFEAALAACLSYEAHLVGTTVSGKRVNSLEQLLAIPCLNMAVRVAPQPVTACNDPSLQKLQLAFAPASLNGSTLKLLTLSQIDATGQEDVLFNINQPRSIALANIEAPPPHVFTDTSVPEKEGSGETRYPYTFIYDTSRPDDGQTVLVAKLIDVNDASITLPIPLIVDQTPPTLTLNHPPEGELVCGTPVSGADGVIRNVVTIDGSVEDAHGLHYLVRRGDHLIYDSRKQTISPTGELMQLNPQHEAFHLTHFTGPLAQVIDGHGEVTLQYEVFDWGGLQQCTQQTFFVDAQVEADRPALDRELFSPNGDDITDTASLRYQSHETSTLTVLIYAAGEDSFGQKQTKGDPLRHLETGKSLLAGSYVSTWDGLDDSGQVVPDGWYGIVSTLTDTCGNQSRYEQFVEVDTTPPQAVIRYPTATDPVAMVIEIQGSVQDGHLSAYRVQVGSGAGPETWATLTSGEANTQDSILAQWNTFGLSGPQVIRLSAEDRVGNRTLAEVPLTLPERTHLISGLTAVPSLFSPNGDGKWEQVSFDIGVEADIILTLTIADENGSVRRTLATNESASRGPVQLTWRALDDAGNRVPDGRYTATLRAALSRQPAVTQAETVSVVVDATPPEVDITQPAQGFVTATGTVRGTISDAHLRDYTVSLVGASEGAQPLVLKRDNHNAIESNLGSLQALSEGAYSLIIDARDDGEITVNQRVPFVVDNTRPVVILTAPESGQIIGRNHPPVVIIGRIEEDHLAEYAIQVGIGTTPAQWVELTTSTTLPISDVLGQWEMMFWADGLYTVQVVAEDKAGLRTDTQLTLTIDQTPPTVSLTTPADGAYVTGDMMITGTATDAHLTSYQLAIAPVSAANQWSPLGSGSTAVQAGTLLHWQSQAPDGAYQLRLKATDQADNTAEVLRQITVDTTPPEPATGLVATVTADRHVRLAWQSSPASDLAGYAVYRDGQRLTPDLVMSTDYVDTTVSAGTPERREGRYVYTIVAIDQAGLRSAPAESVTIVVDVTPPQVRLTSPMPNTTVSGVVEIKGTAYSRDDFKHYRLFLGDGTSPASWQLLRQSPAPIQAEVFSQWNTVGLSEGAAYSLKLEAEDLNGNVGRVQLSITVDNQAPTAPSGLIATVSGSDVELNWDANPEPDLLGYLVYRNAQLVQSNSVVVGDLRPLALSLPTYGDQAVSDGHFVYTVTAIDRAGNISAPSPSAAVTINARPPHADIVQPQDGAAFETPLYVLATVTDQDVARVQFEVKAAAAADWLVLESDTTAPYDVGFDPSAMRLPFNTYQLRAVATDTAGSTDPTPSLITVTYADLTRPEAVRGLVAQVDGDGVRLQWQTNSDRDLAGYHVERWANNEAPVRLTPLPVTELHFADADLADATYSYTIIAVDTHTNEANPTAAIPAVVYTPIIQPVPTPTIATIVRLSGRGVAAAALAIDAVSASGTLSLAPAGTDDGGQFAVDIPLELGENHVRLRLTDAAGNISKPATIRVVLATRPSPPTGLVTSTLDQTVSLAWNANPETDIAGYRLWRDNMPVWPDRPLVNLTASASSNTGMAGQVLDGSDTTYWMPDGNSDGSWLLVSWPEPRQVSQLYVQWYSALYWARDFDLEAWSGQEWVRLAAIRHNQHLVTQVDLPQAYRTTQLRVVIRHTDGPFEPLLTAFGGLYTPIRKSLAADHIVGDGRHTYTLTAINQDGFESFPSAPAEAAVGDVTAPDAVGLTAVVNQSDSHLSWTLSASRDVQRYDLYRDGALIAPITDLSSFQYVDTGLVNGAYRYTVQAIDAVGNASESNPVDLTIAVSLLTAPESLRVDTVETGGALELSWHMSQSATPDRFRVLRSIQSGGPYEVIAATAALNISDTGLQNATTYYYVVIALDAVGNPSSPSQEASGTPQDQVVPATPVVYFPTVAGRLLVSQQPSTTIVGMAEPGAEVRLFSGGRFVSTVPTQSVLHELSVPLDSGTHPVLSPDGRYVAYIQAGPVDQDLEGEEEGGEEGGGFSETAASGQRLRVYDIADDTFIDVTAVEQTTYLRWSADGKALFFNEHDANQSAFFVRQYSVADNQLSDLSDPSQTDISAIVSAPDGTRLIRHGTIQGRSGLWLRAADAALDTLLVSTAAVGDIDGASLQWSPDGRYLAYTRSGAYEIVTIETGEVQPIDTAASNDLPRWSPDGRSLLYGSAQPLNQIYRYELSTQTQQAIARGLAPQWLATGQSVVYVDPVSMSVVRHDLATGAETVLRQNIALIPETLQTVPSGFVGLALGTPTSSHTFKRLEPAGRFVVDPVGLALGDNLFTATATDTAGNVSAVSDNIVIAYRVDDLADLAITTRDIKLLPAAPQAGERSRVNVTVRNVGSLASGSTTLSLLAINPDGHATLLLNDHDLPSLAAGERLSVAAAWTVDDGIGRYTLVAVVDSANLVMESSEANNTALKDVIITDDALPVITINTNAAVYPPNQLVEIAVTVTNSGDPWMGRIEMAVEDTAGFTVQTLPAEDVDGLAYGESLETIATWQSGATFAGSYQAVVYLRNAQGAVIASATAPFRITAESELTTAVASERLVYGAHETVRVTGVVAYTTGNQLLAGAAAQLRIISSSGAVRAEHTTALGDLLPGTQVSVGLDWHTGAHDVGTYQFILDVTDTSQTLSQAYGQLTLAPSGLQLAGEVALSSGAPAVGALQTVTYRVTNHGNAAVLQLPLSISLINPATGATLQTHEVQADISRSELVTNTVDFTTSSLDLKRYTVALRAEPSDATDGLNQLTLATRDFVVTDRSAPEVRVTVPAEHSFINGTGSLSITARDEDSSIARVEFRLNGGEWQAIPGQHVTTDLVQASLPHLPEGTYTLQARAFDTPGHEGLSPLRLFSVDNTSPQISITGVMTGSVYDRGVTPEIHITEAHLADTNVALNGRPFDVSSRVMDDGQYQLSVSAGDEAGNRAESTVNFTIDTMPPLIQVNGVEADRVYRIEPYTYQVKATHPNGARLSYHLDTAPTGMQIHAETGLVTWTPEAAGTVDVVIRVSDPSGQHALQRYTIEVSE